MSMFGLVAGRGPGMTEAKIVVNVVKWRSKGRGRDNSQRGAAWPVDEQAGLNLLKDGGQVS